MAFRRQPGKSSLVWNCHQRNPSNRERIIDISFQLDISLEESFMKRPLYRRQATAYCRPLLFYVFVYKSHHNEPMCHRLYWTNNRWKKTNFFNCSYRKSFFSHDKERANQIQLGKSDSRKQRVAKWILFDDLSLEYYLIVVWITGSFICHSVLPSFRPSLRVCALACVCAFARSSIRLFVHSFVRPFVRSSIRPFVHSSVRPFVRSSVRPFVRLSVRSFVRSSVRPFVRSSVHPFVHSSVRPLVRSSIRPFVYSSARPLVRSSVRPFVHSSVRPFVRLSVLPFFRPSVPPFVRSSIRQLNLFFQCALGPTQDYLHGNNL